jgi:ribosomal protein S18 acetylase RimI-like enzyme
MAIALHPATPADIPLLGAMNQHLIRDEGHRNRMALDQLEDRMRGFLAADYRALLIQAGTQVVGYLLYRTQPDEYAPTHQRVYIRQTFIVREHRRRGYGRAALELLLRDHLPAQARVELEVLAHNTAAQAFYAALGFQPYCLTLVRELPG